MKYKYYLIIAAIFLELNICAQNNTNSPYSMYGIGYIEPGGFGRNKAMGGTGIALPSEHSLNNLNPASYKSIDSMNFIIETGINSIYSEFSNKSQSQKNLNANFAYLAMGFRITRWWGNSIGLSPYSNVGYKINTQKQIEGTTSYADVTIEGSGGLNQFYWGNSFKLNKNFSLGINAAYLFGTINQKEVSETDVTGSISIDDESFLRNFCFSYGAQYSFKLNKDWEGIIGAVYGNKTKLTPKHQISVLYSGDTLYSENKRSKDFYIPQYFGVGASVKFKNRYVLSLDYTQNNWSDIQNNTSGIKFTNSSNIAAGLEIIPDLRPSSGFLKTLRYRVGGYYEKSYMSINEQQLKDYGVTAGIGFPILKGKTFVNVSLSGGFKGVPGSSGNIKENYYKLNLNFTLFDLWFNRYKYD
jgi:long-subunit fatty acid transport protein